MRPVRPTYLLIALVLGLWLGQLSWEPTKALAQGSPQDCAQLSDPVMQDSCNKGIGCQDIDRSLYPDAYTACRAARRHHRGVAGSIANGIGRVIGGVGSLIPSSINPVDILFKGFNDREASALGFFTSAIAAEVIKTSNADIEKAWWQKQYADLAGLALGGILPIMGLFALARFFATANITLVLRFAFADLIGAIVGVLYAPSFVALNLQLSNYLAVALMNGFGESTREAMSKFGENVASPGILGVAEMELLILMELMLAILGGMTQWMILIVRGVFIDISTLILSIAFVLALSAKFGRKLLSTLVGFLMIIIWVLPGIALLYDIAANMVADGDFKSVMEGLLVLWAMPWVTLFGILGILAILGVVGKEGAARMHGSMKNAGRKVSQKTAAGAKWAASRAVPQGAAAASLAGAAGKFGGRGSGGPSGSKGGGAPRPRASSSGSRGATGGSGGSGATAPAPPRPASAPSGASSGRGGPRFGAPSYGGGGSTAWNGSPLGPAQSTRGRSSAPPAHGAGSSAPRRPVPPPAGGGRTGQPAPPPQSGSARSIPRPKS
jgi:hypothetical protein